VWRDSQVAARTCSSHRRRRRVGPQPTRWDRV